MAFKPESSPTASARARASGYPSMQAASLLLELNFREFVQGQSEAIDGASAACTSAEFHVRRRQRRLGTFPASVDEEPLQALGICQPPFRTARRTRYSVMRHPIFLPAAGRGPSVVRSMKSGIAASTNRRHAAARPVSPYNGCNARIMLMMRCHQRCLQASFHAASKLSSSAIRMGMTLRRPRLYCCIYPRASNAMASTKARRTRSASPNDAG